MTTRERSYTLSSVISAGVHASLAAVHTAIPGRIVKFDASTQLADVLPLVQLSFLDETGALQTETLPIVVDVPVCFPGAGGFTLTFPIKADSSSGDTVVLLFSEASLDEWIAQGRNDTRPADFRRFHLSDGMAILGLRDKAHARPSVPTDHVVLGQEAANGVAIHIDGSSVKLGSSTNVDNVALATAVSQAFTNVLQWLTTHTHPTPPASPSPGTSGPSTLPGPTIPQVGSSNVMAKK